eukprot:Skav202200  [mRNA]  locus=scaffold2207:33969:34591:- [translate_table: standard]
MVAHGSPWFSMVAHDCPWPKKAPPAVLKASQLLPTRLVIVGDTHGQLADVRMELASRCLLVMQTYLFNGDMVDRGSQACGEATSGDRDWTTATGRASALSALLRSEAPCFAL